MKKEKNNINIFMRAHTLNIHSIFPFLKHNRVSLQCNLRFFCSRHEQQDEAPSKLLRPSESHSCLYLNMTKVIFAQLFGALCASFPKDQL